ncbi:unnamed protein product, partial [Mesorhabditis belari]|uniref:Centriolar and ciliogenesis-associated protein HYLS1 C-terminal domain-containing protein n=1 Tax=Mesorhabditis belari TaxID=2138241 RepID=A0AAF3FEP5_9BILA
MEHHDYGVTTDDILEVLDEMGLELESQEDINELVQAVQDIDSGSLDDSVFIDKQLETLEDEYQRQEPPISTYTLPISQRRPDALYTDQFLPEYRPRLDATHLTISAIPDVDRLIACAYDMIGHLYETSKEIDNYLASHNQGFNLELNRNSENKENLYTENMEPSRVPISRSHSFECQTKIPPTQPSKIHRIYSQPCTSNPDNVKKATEAERELEPLKSAKELGLRSILNPEPGRLGYRCDPVRKLEMVREGWKQMPPVNENKRLALRWRVREYMLRQAEPSYDPRRAFQKGPSKPLIHPKDWSPRPYLD